MAHEIWHLIENDFQVRNYPKSIEFRRQLGQALGVQTLEEAVKGDHPKARESWKHARARLVEEVSPYGATKVVEATAEMFKAWWCRAGETTPVVTRFGELLDEYFPNNNPS